MTFFHYAMIAVPAFLVGIAATAIVATTLETKVVNVEHQQEIRVWHEYLKACEARMMYLDHVVDKAGIEVIQ